VARTWNPDMANEVFRAVVVVTHPTYGIRLEVFGPYADRRAASAAVTRERRSWWNTRDGAEVTGHVERSATNWETL
jgi:hypothetical protein